PPTTPSSVAETVRVSVDPAVTPAVVRVSPVPDLRVERVSVEGDSGVGRRDPEAAVAEGVRVAVRLEVAVGDPVPDHRRPGAGGWNDADLLVGVRFLCGGICPFDRLFAGPHPVPFLERPAVGLSDPAVRDPRPAGLLLGPVPLAPDDAVAVGVV